MCLRFQKEISSSGGRNNSIYLLPNNENQGRATFINQSTGRPVFLLFYIWSKWLMEKTMFHQFTVKIHIIAHTHNITQFWFDLLREGDWLQKMFAILSNQNNSSTSNNCQKYEENSCWINIFSHHFLFSKQKTHS